MLSNSAAGSRSNLLATKTVKHKQIIKVLNNGRHLNILYKELKNEPKILPKKRSKT